MATTTISQKGEVIVEKDKLVIKNFETYDREIVSYFQDIQPEIRREKLENSLKVGVVAVKTVGVAERINYIEKAFNDMSHNFDDVLRITVQQLDKKYEEMFGERGKFGEIITQHFGEDGKIVKELFDPNKVGTPLYNLLNQVKTEIFQLGQQIGLKKDREQERQKTPQKGKDFEELCEDLIAGVAHHYSDILLDTRDVVGKLTDCKKGDYVVTVPSNDKKIVFEVKDKADLKSSPEIQETLKKSMENRGASYGILVIKYVESFPKGVGWFLEYENNMLACALSTKEREENLHYELLLIAYKWARARLMLQSFKDSKVDVEFIQNRIERIQQKLRKLSDIKAECTNLETSSTKIRTITTELEENIGRELSGILESITQK